MDWERQLIDSIAKTGQISNLMSEGIREDHFENESNGEIFKFLTEHYREYKIPPIFDTVQAEFPLHAFEPTGESVQFLIDKFKKQVLRRYAAESLIDIAEKLDDPKNEEDIDSLFMEHSRRLATVLPKAKLHSFKDIEHRIAEYERWKPEDDVGIRMGIPAIDNVTLGIQPHEYVTVFGRTGIGKSILSQWMLFNAWMQNKTPMYISLEMEANALFRRWDTMLTNFEYNDLKGHSLREEKVALWKERAKEVISRPNDIIVMDDVRGCTVDRVYAELTRWQPDILCIDYITLMSVRSSYKQSWEKIMYLTQELKQISRTLNIPIIGVAQANRDSFREGTSLDNIGGSISAVQDADLVFGLHSDEEMREDRRTELRLHKNRDGIVGNFNLYWKPDTMEFGPYDETRLLKSRMEDFLPDNENKTSDFYMNLVTQVK